MLSFFWVLLIPLSWLFSFLTSLALRTRKTNRYQIPVISVGNLHLGGMGKTPLVVALANHFSGLSVAVISRGYRGRASKKGEKVNLNHSQGPSWFGDEPWMIAQNTSADVFVGKNRNRNFKKYRLQESYDLAILDDGFQHTQIARNIDILVFSAEEDVWELLPIPLGGLRESLASVERATHIVFVYSCDAEKEQLEQKVGFFLRLNPQLEIFSIKRTLQDPVHRLGAFLSGDEINWGGFCGVARAHRFEKDLSQKIPVRFFKSYPDHFPYSSETVLRLIDSAKRAGVNALVTTEKDFFKVSEHFKFAPLSLFVAKQNFEFPDGFWKSLEKRITFKC